MREYTKIVAGINDDNTIDFLLILSIPLKQMPFGLLGCFKSSFPIENCILHTAFNVSLGKFKVI